ncbi:nitroreductase family protein [Thiopseudomonas alkaliphila]|uniref:nitroreductase family protein n=1 Tax=Thiopseudomonas alkaliphila TaxID=1697053 RepID=UPI002574CD3D|nr:nitroreductase [Thiopseudomonas alkaliphila]MDM1707286.1 nitroreductase [Thiopseudomonas alkaliphila]
MTVIDLLLQRVSVPRLGGNPPTAAQREIIFQAALRAPDHAQLRPWRFFSIEGEAREKLGTAFADGLQADHPELSAEQYQKAAKSLLRAPWVVAVVVSPSPHPKVPLLEQQLAAGCAAHAMLYAAHAQQIGAVWRTGDMAYHPSVQRYLQLKDDEQILGFLYFGEPLGNLKTPPQLNSADFVSCVK